VKGVRICKPDDDTSTATAVPESARGIRLAARRVIGGREMTRRRGTHGTAVQRRIVLTPVGAIEESLLHTLVPFLKDPFGATIATTEPVSLPDAAYNSARRQYQSTVLLDALAQQKQPEWERQLGMTDVDLYTPDLNFVFGEADVKRGIAVFSTARLPHGRPGSVPASMRPPRRFMSWPTPTGSPTVPIRDA
jgi:hypothetical protein